MPEFAHLADLQIGATKRIANYLLRQMTALEYAMQVTFDRGIRTVVISGDIYDHKSVTREERNAFLNWMFKWDRKGMAILVQPGNHDVVRKRLSDKPGKSGFASVGTNLHDLQLISEQGGFLHSWVQADWEFKLLERNGIRVAMLPLPVGNSDYFRKGLSKIKRLPKKKGGPLVVMLHETVAGAILDNGYSAENVSIMEELGQDHPRVRNAKIWTSIELPDYENVTYWALGDIHKYGRVAPRAYYAGSPLQHKFGERLPKGFLIVDTDHPDNPEFVEITYENSGVKPLVNVTELPPSAYSDEPEAYYKLHLSPGSSVKDIGVLPSSCISVKQAAHVSPELHLQEDEHPLKSVHELAREKVPDEALRQKVITLVKSLAANQGLQI